MINNANDFSGMFSKAGKVSLEMFSLLQMKDEILNDKKRYFKPSEGFGHNKIEEEFKKKEQEEAKNSDAANKKLQKLSRPKKEHKTKEPFTKMLSREMVENVKGDMRNTSQSYGMYNPRYHLIFKKSPLYEVEEDIKKRKKEQAMKGKQDSVGNSTIMANNTRMSQTKLDYNSDLDQSMIENFFKKKVKGSVDFDNQVPRSFLFTTNLNENRFEYIHLPKIYSKVKEPRNVFLWSGGRDPKYGGIFKNNKTALEYKPNYDFVLPNSRLNIPDFGKTTARKNDMKMIYTLNDQTHFDSFEEHSQLSKKVKSPNFDKMLARDSSLRHEDLSIYTVREKKKNGSKIKDLNNSSQENTYEDVRTVLKNIKRDEM